MQRTHMRPVLLTPLWYVNVGARGFQCGARRFDSGQDNPQTSPRVLGFSIDDIKRSSRWIVYLVSSIQPGVLTVRFKLSSAFGGGGADIQAM